MTKALIIWYLITNIVMFCIMGIDKFKAKHNLWRIPEAVLFTFAYLGGFVGSYSGMYIFHHKTKKWYFHLNFALASILHITAIYLIAK